MNFDIFNENYYLAKYPDVKAAKDAGSIPSGLAHFQQFGRREGRTLVSPYYGEAFYRANNPDVDNAVRSGIFTSGLDHLIQFGYEEGRTPISPYYVESFYLQSNPDVAAAVQAGTFKSGLQHYIRFGAGENRLATSFLEPEYLRKNPDVAAAVRAGAFSSGLEHYLQFGQFEPSRKATFVGTREKETVTAFGVGEIEITGVEVSTDANGNRIYESRGEDDTLVGSAGSDTFILGDRAAYIDTYGGLQPSRLIELYGGFNYFGNLPPIVSILNFDPAKDYIQLPGTTIDYNISVSGNQARIDPIPPISSVPITYGLARIVGNNPLNGIESRIKYLSPVPPFEQNFLDPRYLAYNPDVRAAVSAGSFTSGLDHYRQFGQFEPNRTGFFSGTRGNDIVTGFGVGKTEITGVEQVYSDYGQGDGYKTRGENEFDTLIGGAGADTFMLGGYIPGYRGFALPVQFYQGVGEARIVGFNQSQGDSIKLFGNINNYQVFPSGSDLIIAVGEDRRGIIEGGAGLNLTLTDNNGMSAKLV